MNIDWFTFAAQIINFLVLVALLRWLLYGPIVRAMEQREKKIADRLEEAEEKRQKADDRMHEYERKTDELEQEREQILKQAKQEADERRQQLVGEARESVDAKRQEWQEALAQERENLIKEVRREAGRVGLRAARQTLVQLADADLEQQLCEAFVRRIEQLDEDHRQDIADHFENDAAEVVVSSQFELPENCRDRLRETIHHQLQFDGEITFETSPDLMCGLELQVGGYSFGWNVKGFLEELQHRLDQKLKV